MSQARKPPKRQARSQPRGPQRGPPRGAAGGSASRSSSSRSSPPRSSASRGGSARRGSSSRRGLGGEQVEGRQAVRELLLAGRRRVHELWVAGEPGDPDTADDLVSLARELRVPVHHVGRRRLDAEARSEANQGVLARAAPVPEADLDDLLAELSGQPPPFLVLVDGVTDPQNLGALLRSADGAGVTGVVLPRHRAVHVTPTVAKAAAGAVEHVPMALVPGVASALEDLKRAGLWVAGLHDRGDRSLFELGDLAEGPLALVLGAEGAGLSRLARERCDVLVAIPMLGALSSLNVSAAATLAMYEVTRHRG